MFIYFNVFYEETCETLIRFYLQFHNHAVVCYYRAISPYQIWDNMFS